MESAQPSAIRLLLKQVPDLQDHGTLDGRDWAVDAFIVVMELKTARHVLEEHGELAVIGVRVQSVRRSAGQWREWHAQEVVPGGVGAHVARLEHLTKVFEVLHAQDLAHQAHVLEGLLVAGREPLLEEFDVAGNMLLNQVEIGAARWVRPAGVAHLHSFLELGRLLLTESLDFFRIPDALGGNGVTNPCPAFKMIACIIGDVHRVLDR